ncbi:MAG: hypothetical protein ACOC22_03705 [bacterium]
MAKLKPKYRVDIRKSKAGKIIKRYWTDYFNPETEPSCFIDVYRYYGKRLIKVLSHKPIDDYK